MIPDTRIGCHASELVSRSKLLRQWGVTRQLRPRVEKTFFETLLNRKGFGGNTPGSADNLVRNKSKSGKPCLLLREGVKLALNVQVTPRERSRSNLRTTRFGSIGCARCLNVDSTAWLRSPRMAFCLGAGSTLTSRRMPSARGIRQLPGQSPWHGFPGQSGRCRRSGHQRREYLA
jgi:hypothetical protein